MGVALGCNEDGWSWIGLKLAQEVAGRRAYLGQRVGAIDIAGDLAHRQVVVDLSGLRVCVPHQALACDQVDLVLTQFGTVEVAQGVRVQLLLWDALLLAVLLDHGEHGTAAPPCIHVRPPCDYGY